MVITNIVFIKCNNVKAISEDYRPPNILIPVHSDTNSSPVMSLPVQCTQDIPTTLHILAAIMEVFHYKLFIHDIVELKCHGSILSV